MWYSSLTNGSSPWATHPKFDLPRFDGAVDPRPWVCRVDRYYHIYGTCEAEKVLIVALRLGGHYIIFIICFMQTNRGSLYNFYKVYNLF